MSEKKRIIICVLLFLFFLALGGIWAGSDPTIASPAERFSISMVLGALLAASLYFLLRQNVIVRRAEQPTDLAREQFVTNVSHEVRTPLAGILGVMHLLRRTQLDHNQHRYVDTATNSANMLLAIVNDLMAVPRSDAGSFSIESENLDLAEVVEDVTSILAPEAFNKGLELVSDVDPNIPYRFEGDPLRLQQVLHNLLNNAIKYTENGVIVVYVKNLGNTVECGVKDSGPGIDPELQTALLSPPQQDSENRQKPVCGAGLGLNSSQRLIGAMGGQLKLESELGKGSRFYFRLAIKEADSRSFDWKPPQALQRLGIGILSPLALQRNSIHNLLSHWKISDIHEFEFDVEEKFDLDELTPCDLLIIDQTKSERAVNDLIDRLRNISDWRETRFVHLVPQNRQSEKGSADLRLYKPISHSRLYSAVMDIVYKLAYDSEYVTDPDSVDSQSSGVLDGRRILLAEDNDINKMIVLEVLEETGVDVDVAVNGADALEQLQRQHYDLVLMDIQMPVMDGYEATRKVRSLGGAFESIPVIAMTAHAFEGDTHKSLEAGMDCHVSKPFEPDALITLIVRTIEGRAGEQLSSNS